MTSGNFHSIPIERIKVVREARQRQDIDERELDTLADSIHRLGLIHPIVVKRDDLSLVAGERRFLACKKLGWENISAQYLDELDEYVVRAIELEENIKRVNISWADECRAMREYHDLRSGVESGWSQDKTAEALGISPQSLSDHLMVEKEIRRNPELLKVPRYSTVKGIVDRLEARRDEKALQ